MAEPLSSEESGTVAQLPVRRAGAARGGATPALDAAARYGLPLSVIAVFLVLWQVLPPALGLRSVEVPNLSATLTDLNDYWSSIGSALIITIQDAIVGFLIGNGLAILGATAFVWFRSLERAFYPVAILVQTIPIIIYAPLFVLIFDKTPVLKDHPEAPSVVLVAVLITFFPTLVNMTVGLKAVDPSVYELMRLLNASKAQIFLKLRFPSAMPFLFSSLKITSTLAFVGAIVGEFTVNGGFNPVGQWLDGLGLHSVLGFATNPAGSQGIGALYWTLYSQLETPAIFASVFAVSILSILFFGLMVLLERLLVPWRKQQ
jgi:NitT/TauT family transport system permease protein